MPSIACCFHVLICVGCSCRFAAISCTVLSLRSASSDIAALNLSEKFHRFVILASIHLGWIHLGTLSKSTGPLQFLKHDEVLGAHAPNSVNYTHDQYVEKILSDMVGGFSSTFLQADEMESRIREDLKRDLVEKLEPALLNALAARFIKNNWRTILGILFISFNLAYFSGVSSYFHSPEQLRGLVDERIEESKRRDKQE